MGVCSPTVESNIQASAVVNDSIIAGALGVAVILIAFVISAPVIIYVVVKKRRWNTVCKPGSEDVKRPWPKPFERELKRKKDKDPLVLVIYSPDSSEEDRHRILQYLVKDLGEYCRVECHDCFNIRQSAPEWLQTKVREASVVLCVCNPQFQREWDQKETSPFPLIFSLEQLVHGILNKSNPLSKKFATVLLRESEHECIPDYLHSTRKFLVDEVEVIAEFVQGVSKYENPGMSWLYWCWTVCPHHIKLSFLYGNFQHSIFYGFTNIVPRRRASTLHAVRMQKRAALLIVLFLSPLVITSTASDDLRGVCAEGECTELPARVTCRGAHIDDSYVSCVNKTATPTSCIIYTAKSWCQTGGRCMQLQ